MIHTIKAWLAEDGLAWTNQLRKYKGHLAQFDRHNPRLAAFARAHTLHDDHIQSVHLITDLPTGRDAVIVIKSYRCGIIGTACLHILHLVGVSGPIRKIRADHDILFYDVEVLDSGFLRMTLF